MAVRLEASQPARIPPTRGRSRNTAVSLGWLLCNIECLTNITLQYRVWQVQDPLVAELAYRETVAARERVRGIQRAITLPLRLLAAADLIGAGVVLVVGRFHLGSYFAPCYLAVLLVSGWWYRRYATNHGVLLPVRPWVLLLIATIAAAASLSRLGVALDESWISDFGPCLAIAVGTAITAGWLRSRRLA